MSWIVLLSYVAQLLGIGAQIWIAWRSVVLCRKAAALREEASALLDQALAERDTWTKFGREQVLNELRHRSWRDDFAGPAGDLGRPN